MRIQINETTARKAAKVLAGARDPDLQEIAADITERLEKQQRVGFLTPNEIGALVAFLPGAVEEAATLAKANGKRLGLEHPITVIKDSALPKLRALAER